MLWFHIPYIITVYGTSNGPQNDFGNYLVPCRIASSTIPEMGIPMPGWVKKGPAPSRTIPGCLKPFFPCHFYFSCEITGVA